MTIRRNLAVITSRLTLFALVAGICFLGALAVDRAMPKMYTSSARLVIQPETVKVPPADTSSGPTVNALEFMQTQVEIARSPSTLRRIVEQEGLHTQIDALSTPMDQFAESVNRFEVFTHLKDAEDPNRAGLARATELLLARSKATVVRDSYILQLDVSTRDPNLSERLARDMVSSYLDSSNSTKLAKLNASASVLSSTADDARKRLQTATENLAAFDTANGTVTQTSSSQTKDPSGTGVNSSNTTTISDNPKRVERQRLEFAVTSEQGRLQTALTQLDSTQVEIAAIRGQVSPTDILDSPRVSRTPDGISAKFRYLFYLLLAPLVGAFVCYGAHYLEIYRRSAPRPVVVQQQA